MHSDGSTTNIRSEHGSVFNPKERRLGSVKELEACGVALRRLKSSFGARQQA